MGLEKYEARLVKTLGGTPTGDVHGRLWVPGLGICPQGTVKWVNNVTTKWGCRSSWGAEGTGWSRG